MIWSFQRYGEQLRCEIRREAEGEAFEFALIHPDGTEQVEKFADSAELVEHSVRQLESLVEQGWKVLTPPGAGR